MVVSINVEQVAASDLTYEQAVVINVLHRHLLMNMVDYDRYDDRFFAHLDVIIPYLMSELGEDRRGVKRLLQALEKARCIEYSDAGDKQIGLTEKAFHFLNV